MIKIGLDPVIFSIGSFVVRWYGLMIDAAVITVVLWALHGVQKSAKLNYDTILNAALVGVPSGLIFSRVLHIIDQWSYFSTRPLSALLSGEGLTIYGAILGAVLGLWVYSKYSRFQFGLLADIIAPATILGQAIGRIGCFLNGCCYGLVTDLPWSVLYTNKNSYGFLASSNLPEGVGLHPSVVYEFIWDMIVFGIVLKIGKRFKPDGALFAIYFALYAFGRLFIDFTRDGTPFLLGLHQAQVMSLAVLLITLPWLLFKTHRATPAELVAAIKQPDGNENHGLSGSPELPPNNDNPVTDDKTPVSEEKPPLA
jgi:phosphatidylglycerol:prolipoprotein diacylglycerol transferase